MGRVREELEELLEAEEEVRKALQWVLTGESFVGEERWERGSEESRSAGRSAATRSSQDGER